MDRGKGSPQVSLALAIMNLNVFINRVNTCKHNFEVIDV